MVGRQANGTLVNGSLYMWACNALRMAVAIARLEASAEWPALHVGRQRAIVIGTGNTTLLLGCFPRAIHTTMLRLHLRRVRSRLGPGWWIWLAHRFRWIVRAHEPRRADAHIATEP